MIRLITWTAKTAAVGLLAIVVGNLVYVGGMTLSDQVKLQLNRLERTEAARTVRKSVATWTDTMTWSKSQVRRARDEAESLEKLSSRERKALRELIENQSH